MYLLCCGKNRADKVVDGRSGGKKRLGMQTG